MAVLVAHTTCREPLRAIAERLASRLRLLGVVADARPVSDPIDVAAYEGIVLGSAIRAGEWLPDGCRFALENAVILRRRLTWLFSVGSEVGRPSVFRARTAERIRALHRETEQIDALRDLTDPLEYRYFAGAIAGSRWSTLARSVFPGPLDRRSDRGSWVTIDAWASSIASDIGWLSKAQSEPALA